MTNLLLRRTWLRACRCTGPRSLLPLLLLCLLVSACGQRGPLYLPEADNAPPAPASDQSQAEDADDADDDPAG